MKLVIVGLGVQGIKRKKILSKKYYVCSVDPKNKNADYKKLQDVPLNLFNSCFICVPDDQKFEIINYCIENNKHILVEKPLFFQNINKLDLIEKKANDNKTIIYTAYNHRFEPNFIRMKKLIESGRLGKIYSCRMFYGNGTAKLVKNSPWRDKSGGVINDLGSHLIDTCIFWFGNKLKNFELVSAFNHENYNTDHAILKMNSLKIKIQLEMTLCMWKNNFTCDILAEKGSAHIESLCKWGETKFIHRERKLPSGIPKEFIIRNKSNDPTWRQEHIFFKKKLVKFTKNNLKTDKMILNNLINLI